MRKNGRLFIALLTIVIAIVTVFWDAVNRWRRATEALVRRLRAARRAPAGSRVTDEDLSTLPAPVAAYLRKVLGEGHPIITAARVTQHGVFRMPSGAWQPFDAEAHYTATPPGFVWDARVEIAPQIPLFVRDAIVEGEAGMTASTAGLVKMLDIHGRSELLEAALQRYLAEAVWFPTAFLPSQGVTWTAIDASTARASLTLLGTAASLDFRFADDGLISTFHTPARYREEDGAMVQRPWGGTYKRYEERRHVLVPIKGEVSWELPEGRLSYWRGSVVRIDYDYAV